MRNKPTKPLGIGLALLLALLSVFPLAAQDVFSNGNEVAEKDIDIESIEITSVLPELITDESYRTFRIEKSIYPVNASSTPEWISSNPNVASVDADGYVTIHDWGIVTITVTTSNGIMDSIELSAALDNDLVAPEGHDALTVARRDGGAQLVNVDYTKLSDGELEIPATVTRNGLTLNLISATFDNDMDSKVTTVTIADSDLPLNIIGTIKGTGFKTLYCGRNLDWGDQTENILGVSNNTTVTLGEKMTAVASHQFEGAKISTLTLPYTIETIGDYAFPTMQIRGKLVIPGNIRSIGANAFMSCRGITALDFSTCENLKFIGENAFNTLNRLDSLTINNCNGLAIGARAFADCPKMTKVEISGVGNTYGEGAFQNCKILESVKLSGMQLGDNALATNPALTKINLDVENIGSNILKNANEASVPYESPISIVLGDNVKNIGSSAFYNITMVKNVKFGLGLEKIGDFAFSGCDSLVSIIFPTTEQADAKIEIGGRAFDGRYKKLVDLGNHVKSVGSFAFVGADSLNLGSSVQSIANRNFRSLGNKELVIPASLTGVGLESLGGIKRMILSETSESIYFETNGNGNIYDYI